MNIKDIVKDTTAEFKYYYDSQLWYEIEFFDTETNMKQAFMFPVPISDIGNATFKRTDKALLFMRYVRKHLTVINEKGIVNV